MSEVLMIHRVEIACVDNARVKCLSTLHGATTTTATTTTSTTTTAAAAAGRAAAAPGCFVMLHCALLWKRKQTSS